MNELILNKKLLMLRLLLIIVVLLSNIQYHNEYGLSIQSLKTNQYNMHCHLDVPKSYNKNYQNLCSITNEMNQKYNVHCGNRISINT